MAPYLIVAGVAVALVVVVTVLNSRGTPSLAMFRAIPEAILALPAQAAANVARAADDGDDSAISEDAMERQTRRVRETIRFVFTIDEDAGRLIHTVSSQLIATRSEKYQAQCMLIVMMVWNGQLDSAGIDRRTIAFDITRSDFGTHYLMMALTPEQHAKLL